MTNVVEQELDTEMQWTAISLTHVEYQKGFRVNSN